MSSTGNRLKEIRKDNKLTQAQFGQKIGLKDSAVSMLEKNDRRLTESVIKNIITQFCVNELWLKEGEGEKYNKELLRKKEILEYISLSTPFINMNIDYIIEKIKLLKASEQEDLVSVLDKLCMVFTWEPDTDINKYITLLKNELVKYLKIYLPDIDVEKAIEESITGVTLTDEEGKILILYRSLNSEDRGEVLSFLNFKNSIRMSGKKK
ncbi:helix-turn-helix protein [Ruminiclostridium sufflavum DSM 19573]|uniref:Helix-turn-helix protein n=1 Tax=Ruminiclostridium sufflavum DSM 19573 TaxID=1121337 RepID=A0A318XNF4_9FIRM|nr:helix-turn-helix transcriptional regulator [Ruminiclostridium sufflavum]PYG89557.1 helix-turn-helix protein [Ruminiclostridium sufflavum DSM 19573]